jgi:hypothetical protein
MHCRVDRANQPILDNSGNSHRFPPQLAEVFFEWCWLGVRRQFWRTKGQFRCKLFVKSAATGTPLIGLKSCH